MYNFSFFHDNHSYSANYVNKPGYIEVTIYHRQFIDLIGTDIIKFANKGDSLTVQGPNILEKNSLLISIGISLLDQSIVRLQFLFNEKIIDWSFRYIHSGIIINCQNPVFTEVFESASIEANSLNHFFESAYLKKMPADFLGNMRKSYYDWYDTKCQSEF